MSRRATFRLADVRRTLEGAKRAGARRVTIDLRDGKAEIDLGTGESVVPPHAQAPEPRGRKYVL